LFGIWKSWERRHNEWRKSSPSILRILGDNEFNPPTAAARGANYRIANYAIRRDRQIMRKVRDVMRYYAILCDIMRIKFDMFWSTGGDSIKIMQKKIII